MATAAPITGAPTRVPSNLYHHSYRAPFLDEVEAFLARTGVGPTTLGFKALGDFRFVKNLRDGRDPRSRTIAKVRVAMAALEGR